MTNRLTVKHETWVVPQSGYKGERWDIYRNDYLLGSISLSPTITGWANSGKWQACASKNYKARWFIKFESAVRWIEKEMQERHPIGELSNLLSQ
jgi:hypothetical protein